MTEPSRNTAIVSATGWTAWTLTLRGVVLEMCAGASVLLFVLCSYLPGRWYYWAILFGTFSLVLLTLGASWSFLSFSRTKREMERGYTTIWKVAVEHPELTYLWTYDFGVISGPGEPRPRNGTRKVVDAFRAPRVS